MFLTVLKKHSTTIVVGIILIAINGLVIKSVLSGFKPFSNEGGTVILTRSSVNDLIKKAADQEYFQDVLMSGPKIPDSVEESGDLPIKGAVIKQSLPLPIAGISKSPKVCHLAGQSYSVGDTVQLKKGWGQCTLTIAINDDGSTKPSIAVWTPKVSLLD